jgi:hypothetical protein
MFASLVLLTAAAKKKPGKTGASSWQITNLDQSILETFDIFDENKVKDHWFAPQPGKII